MQDWEEALRGEMSRGGLGGPFGLNGHGSQAGIQGGLGGVHAARVIVRPVTSSTQDDVRRAINAMEATRGCKSSHHQHNIIIAIARTQRRGRGRMGRAWEDGAGLGVCVSIGVPCAFTVHDGPWVAVATGIGVCRAARSMAPAHVRESIRLKWPNDIIHAGVDSAGNAVGAYRKLGGVLIERTAGGGEGKHPWWIIGVGLNIAHPPGWFTRRGLTACSLAMIGGARARPQTLHLPCAAGRIITSVLGALCEESEALLPSWREMDGLPGRNITLESRGEEYHGTIISLNPVGNILLQTDAGPVTLAAATTRRVET